MPSSRDRCHDWEIAGAAGETIYGTTHVPAEGPRGVVLVAHGFKGYKDYGMFPLVAARLADAGYVAHRFNFSHSGMTPRIDTFERPDLFERDTWNRQVEDLNALLAAVDAGTLDGHGLPRLLVGHSRGGVAVLLAAGRSPRPTLAGVATLSAPSRCLMMSAEDVIRLERDGHLVSPSSRTGQALRVGKAFLDEQRADPAGHDLVEIAAGITCPVLIIHGADDPTVPATCGRELATATGGRLVEIDGADHVFNTPNPMPPEAPPSPALARVLATLVAFAEKCCG